MNELTAVRSDLIAAIKTTPDPRPSTVIPRVSQTHLGADVRLTYWRMLDEHVITRALDGTLAVVDV